MTKSFLGPKFQNYDHKTLEGVILDDFDEIQPLNGRYLKN